MCSANATFEWNDFAKRSTKKNRKGSNAGRDARLNNCMRFYEFAPAKRIKPLTPPQARLHKLKAVATKAKADLKNEREAQKRQKTLNQQRKQLGHGRPINNPNSTL